MKLNKGMTWKDFAIKALEDSLNPVPTELNEIDWKADENITSKKYATYIPYYG